MKARKVAAQFAAYAWFESTQTVERSAAEKARFARKNWRAFLPVAQTGLGRLLMRIDRGRLRNQRTRALLDQVGNDVGFTLKPTSVTIG